LHFQLGTEKDFSANQASYMEKYIYSSPFTNVEWQQGSSFTRRRVLFYQGIGITVYGHPIGEDGKRNHKNT
jgi:hypothetical protein